MTGRTTTITSLTTTKELNIAMAWLFGKSVLETRGFTVNYVVHVAADSIIFAFFVMALASNQ